MSKLKMLVLTALAAATVGTGALAGAPSASAQPNPFQSAVCGEISKRLLHASEMADDIADMYGTHNWMYVYWNNKAVQAGANYKAWGC
jgi:hypothetical protein